MIQPSAQRSATMKAVRSKDTGPEIEVRRFVYGLGYRYRLHRQDLPGKPDIVFPSLKKVIFVHGCFWHGHSCSRGARLPKTNGEYWKNKIDRNRKRDEKHINDLASLGWRALIVWECNLHNAALRQSIEQMIQGYLSVDPILIQDRPFA
jgi:DNA mismatch endonuclease (patch repair protein)